MVKQGVASEQRRMSIVVAVELVAVVVAIVVAVAFASFVVVVEQPSSVAAEDASLEHHLVHKSLDIVVDQIVEDTFEDKPCKLVPIDQTDLAPLEELVVAFVVVVVFVVVVDRMVLLH